MRFLVTGGTGALGSWVTRNLVEQGHEVAIYDLRPDLLLLKDLAGQVRLIVGDITDLSGLMRAAKEFQPERIIHLAIALWGDEQPVVGFQINANGMQNVLETALVFDCDRVVYTSSKATYGHLEPEYGAPTWKRLTEDHVQLPYTMYGVSKLAAEHLCRFYTIRYGLEHVILRFPALFGPGRLARHRSLAFGSRLLENAMAGQPTVMPKAGDWADELLYNRDVATGIVLAATVDTARLEHRVFHIGHGQVTTMQQLADAVHELYPSAEITIEPGDMYGTAHSLFDMSRAQRELGYQPRFTNHVDAYRDYVAWMTKLGIQPTVTPNE